MSDKIFIVHDMLSKLINFKYLKNNVKLLESRFANH